MRLLSQNYLSFTLAIALSLLHLFAANALDHVVNEISTYSKLEHPLTTQLLTLLKNCEDDTADCLDRIYSNVTILSARIANEHATLLMHDQAQSLFEDVLYYLPPNATLLRGRIYHILAVLAFAEGRTKIVGFTSLKKSLANSSLILIIL